VVDELEQAGHEARADLILDALLERADSAPSAALDEAIGAAARRAARRRAHAAAGAHGPRRVEQAAR
jgi:hypothetical protein